MKDKGYTIGAFLFAALVVVNGLPGSLDYDQIPLEKATCGPCDYTIGASQINSRSGLVLYSYGTYCLSEDVMWYARSNETAAITIAGDKISLNLQGHFISQNNLTGTYSNIGILVKNNTRNILIYNGILDRFSGLGIYVQSGVNTIIISQMLIRESGYRGQFNDALFTRPFAGGILIAGTDRYSIKTVRVEDTLVTNLTCVFPLVGGIPAGGCNGVTIIRAEHVAIERFRSSSLWSNDAAGHIFYGAIRNLYINDCQLTGSYGDRATNGIDTMVGPSRQAVNVVITNVFTGDLFARRAEALGIEHNAINFYIGNCHVFNVTSLDNRAAGFVTQDDDGPGMFEDCTVSDITGILSRPGNIVGGFINTLGNPALPTSIPAKYITYKNCEVKGIYGSGVAEVIAGFHDIRGRGHTIQGMRVVNVVSNSTATRQIVGGIVLNGTQNALVENCVTNLIGGYGIVLHEPGNQVDSTQYNTVRKNSANDNVVGIADLSLTNKTNQISENSARNNKVANYVLPAWVLIRTWQLGSLPSTPSDPLDNLSVLSG